MSDQSLLFPDGIVPWPAPGPRPESLVGITTAGVLVVTDLATGARRELTRQADPRAAPPDEGPKANSLRDVAQSLDGRTVSFAVGPEPVCGSVSDIPLAGGVAVSRDGGTHVSAGPAGHVLVTSGPCGLSIRKGGAIVASIEAPTDDSFGHAAWSGDGRVVAVEQSDGPRPTLILVLDLLTGGTSEIRDPEGVGYRLPAFRSDGRLVVVHQSDDGPATAKIVQPPGGEIVTTFSYGGAVADQAYDASGTWLLVTMADGRLRWFGGGDEGDLGSGYLSADW